MSSPTPRLGPPRRIVPGPASPQGTLASNNNCDLALHDGRLWLAWRTAPVHYASSEARIQVSCSSDLGASWSAHHVVEQGRDVREPRWYLHGGRLHLTFFTAGVRKVAFQPDRVWITRLDGDDWSDPVPVGPQDTVVWRVRPIGGRLHMSVYRHAASLFTRNPKPLEVQLWTSQDGIDWDTDTPVVHPGGSETEFLELPDGRVLAVVRKEGPERGWGSDLGIVDAAEVQDPSAWRWRADPRKFDSPLLFLHQDTPYLLTRKQRAFGGRYDLGLRRGSDAVRTRLYQAAYFVTAKRTALYRVDPDTLSATELFELPSAGDTAFAAQVPLDDRRHLVVNYSSELRPGWRPWFVGQLRPTHLDLFELTF